MIFFFFFFFFFFSSSSLETHGNEWMKERHNTPSKIPLRSTLEVSKKLRLRLSYHTLPYLRTIKYQKDQIPTVHQD